MSGDVHGLLWWRAGIDDRETARFHIFEDGLDILRREETSPAWHTLRLATDHRDGNEITLRHAVIQRLAKIWCIRPPTASAPWQRKQWELKIS